MALLTIGVLALQGNFAKHMEMLKNIGVQAKEVRKPQELEECGGLIIPGGESTTMMKQIQFINFREPLINFAKKHPVFGTCAGLILIAQEIVNSGMIPLSLLEITVERNAFGRQIESFSTTLKLDLEPSGAFKNLNSTDVQGLFIRAPRIKQTSPQVKILASHEGEPVLVRQGHHIGASFHPELTADWTIHQYFIKLVEEKQ